MTDETAPAQGPDHVVCTHCATSIPIFLRYCTKCWTANAARATRVSPRSIVITALLCLFIGGTGAHRFYAGNTHAGFLTTGLLFLCVALFFLVAALDFEEKGPLLVIALFFLINLWSLVDFVRIIFRRYRDGLGRLILD